RVAPFARRTALHREGPEATQLHAIAVRQGIGDLVEDGVDDVFHVALVQVRILRRDPLNELGFDHRVRSLDRTIAEGLPGSPRPVSQSRPEGCQSAKRPSRLSLSIVCIAAESSIRRASALKPTASSTAAVPRWRKSRSPKRGCRRQWRTGHFGSTFFSLASHCSAVSSPPSASASFSSTAWRPVNTRPSATCSTVASSMCRRSFTRARNQAYESLTTDSRAARASGLVGSNPLGAALSGEDFTSSTLTPTVFMSSLKFGNWNRTPIEPTSPALRVTT